MANIANRLSQAHSLTNYNSIFLIVLTWLCTPLFSMVRLALISKRLGKRINQTLRQGFLALPKFQHCKHCHQLIRPPGFTAYGHARKPSSKLTAKVLRNRFLHFPSRWQTSLSFYKLIIRAGTYTRLPYTKIMPLPSRLQNQLPVY